MTQYFFNNKFHKINRLPPELIELREKKKKEGLLETMKLVNGMILFERDHLARLIQGLHFFGISPKKEILDRIMENLTIIKAEFEELKTAKIRLLIFINPSRSKIEGFYFEISSLDEFKNKKASEIRLFPIELPFPDPTYSKGIKSLDRTFYQKDDFPTDVRPLFCINGVASETDISNIFYIKGGIVFTPERSVCGLPGIMRKQLIAYLCSVGIKVEEGKHSLDFVKSCDEVFITNVIRGIQSVHQIEKQNFTLFDFAQKAQKLIDSKITNG